LIVLENYGWYLIFLALLFFFLWHKYGRSIVSTVGSSNSNIEMMKKYDENDLYRKQEAMLAARMKMQEVQNRMSAQYAEMEKQKEEERRQRKLDEWKQFQEGKGYHNKQHFEEAPSVTKIPKSSKKPSLRPDNYNPLMGNSGDSGYKPSRRGGGASGGGG